MSAASTLEYFHESMYDRWPNLSFDAPNYDVNVSIGNSRVQPTHRKTKNSRVMCEIALAYNFFDCRSKGKGN